MFLSNTPVLVHTTVGHKKHMWFILVHLLTVYWNHIRTVLAMVAASCKVIKSFNVLSV